MKSWKTTLCGVLGIVGGALTQIFHDMPLVMKIGLFLSTIGPAIGLLFARDNNVTSEQAGAHKPEPNNLKLLVWLLLPSLLLASGCQSLYRSTVTLTSVVDSGMKMWARLSVAGATSPELDRQVVAAHDRYRAACTVAKNALVTYQRTGNQAAYQQAMEIARSVAVDLVGVLTPILTATEAVQLKTGIVKANAP